MGKIIKKIIGEFLAKYRYEYIKEDDPVRYTFIKEENGITKSISIVRSVHGKFLNLYFGNSNYLVIGKSRRDFCVNVIDEKLENKVYMGYETKDELLKLLDDIKEIILEYGFDFLDYLSNERINISLEEVNKILSKDPKKRAKNFTDKYNLKYEEDELIKVMEIIDNEIKGNNNYDIELLVDMSAYLGEMVIKNIGGKWGICTSTNKFSIVDTFYGDGRAVVLPTELIRNYVDLGELFCFKLDYQYNRFKSVDF